MTATVAGGVRPAAVAGMFYPSDRAELHDLVAGYLAAAPDPVADPAADGASPKAVIAPHAGYRYSGPTAGAAYRSLLARRGAVERVVVIGPAHRVRVAGVGISSARAWATVLASGLAGETARVPVLKSAQERGMARAWASLSGRA